MTNPPDRAEKIIPRSPELRLRDHEVGLRAARGPRPLPLGTTSLVGREGDVDEVAGMLEGSEARLLTLTGPGGIGKSRLSLEAAGRLQARFGRKVAFVPLADVTRPDLVGAEIVRAVGAVLGGATSPLDLLVEQFGDDQWLLILDNLEQVVQVGPDLEELLAGSPGLAILATSRTALGLRAEREYPVSALPLPDALGAPLEELAASASVALFADRARSVRRDFTLNADNAPAVAEICRRVEGLPLAIELAAARTRILDPNALLERLASSLDALGKGPVDLPQRQQTLRTTVEWSVGLLEEAERSLLELAAVFVDGWTLEAAAAVAALDEDTVLELSEALARSSLIKIDTASSGPRCSMLETVRQFVSERLSARSDAATVQHRHADFYRTLAEEADRPLRGAGQGESLDRLEADADNLAAAVRWHLANDQASLPHLFRVLWPFFSLRDRMGETRPWLEQLLSGADSLDPVPRAELAWSAVAYASDAGDYPAAKEARSRLGAVLEDIRDPFLAAISHLVMAWTSPLLDDFDAAVVDVSTCLDGLRGQDEPFWTVVAAFTAGTLENVVGRYDDAQRHLCEARDLATAFGGTALTAGSLVQLGKLYMLQGRHDEAGVVLDEALSLSLASQSTPFVTMTLSAYARLAFADGDPERAALLEGAALGLHQRVGLQPWPMLRPDIAARRTQLREELGADRFDPLFAAGARLNQREAVDVVREGAHHG